MQNKPHDIRIYEEELCPWLPERIIDGHVHIGLNEHCAPISEERLRTNWAYEVGVTQSWESYRQAVEALFPKQQVSALVMGVPFREMDLALNNEYVISGVPGPDTKALFMSSPDWSPDVIEQAFERGFVGLKPYPDLVVSDSPPSIFDFLPHEHLKVLDRRSGILLLHIPRPGRIADRDNIAEIREICSRYPNVKVIVAHIGRAFCLPTALAGLPSLADCRNLWFDNSANLNADVMAFAIELLGPERIIYGSDLPITLIRGMREYDGDNYTNFTDGDYSWNTVRKPPEVEATYTYYLYEELRALIAGVRRAGLGREAVARIMYSNIAGLMYSDSPRSDK